MTRNTDPSIALASAISLPDAAEAPEWVHLLPAAAGMITTFDGRGPYRLRDAAEVIAASMSNPRGMPVDENHATDLAAPLGQPAPARGWIVELQAREDGVWGRVEWTEEGRALVAGRAYRGLSPVLALSQDKRTVKALLRASLVNTPNLRGLTALHQETSMNFMVKLAEALGLKEDATEDDILGAVTSKTDTTALQSSLVELGAALGVEGEASLASVAAAAKAFGKDTVVALQSQLASITTELNTLKEDGKRKAATAFIDGAISDGRVGVKPLRDHYISRHMSDAASVEKEIGALPKLDPVVLGELPKATKENAQVSLNAERQGVRLARAAQDYQAEQKAKGIEVPWADAVTHVSEKR